MKRVFRLLLSLLQFIDVTFAGVSCSLLVPPYKAPDDFQAGRRMVLVPLAITCLIAWGWWTERRRKRLLRSGSVSFAVVGRSDAGHSAWLPGITYIFQLETSQEIADFGHDWTGSFHPGMLVPGFYDPREPQIHVALCESSYDIAY
jgi:hypothetical protein